MSKKAEEKAVEYQIRTHGPNVMGGASMLSAEEYMRFNMNLDFKNGYEQAEKETIERACEWLFSHLPILVDYYDEDIHTNADRSEFIKLFRTQMEEQI